jgi:hypothetical protein
LIAGSVAGVQALLGGSQRFDVGPPGYEVFERTATVEAFTVTSPSSWFLVNEWPLSTQIAVSSTSGSKTCTADTAGNQTCSSSGGTAQAEPVPHGLPMLQLSNVDMGLNATTCGQPLQSDAAVLYVALDYGRAIAGANEPSIGSWPVDLQEPTAGGGPCGGGRYATFTVHGEPFFAWVGFGEGVSDADAATVLAAFDSMAVDDAWEPTQPEHATSGYVIAAGVGSGTDWRLELRPAETNVELSLEGVDPVESMHDFKVPAAPIESSACCAGPVMFGAVSRDAAGVAFQPSDGDPAIAGTVVPLPPTMAFDFDLFFVEGTAGLDGAAIALGLKNVPVSPAPVTVPRDEVVELTGTSLDQPWTARFTGTFADGSACIRARIGDGGGKVCPRPIETSLAGDQPSLHVLSADLSLVVGSVPTDVVEVRFKSDDAATTPSTARCEIGPSGWTDPDKNVCAIALPSQWSGTLEYLDAAGHVVFEEGMGWGTATASAPPPVSTGVPA